MEGWFDLRESNNVIDSVAKEKNPGFTLWMLKIQLIILSVYS